MSSTRLAASGCRRSRRFTRFRPSSPRVRRHDDLLDRCGGGAGQHHRLPNVITLPGVVAGFLLSLVTEPGWMASLIGIALGGGILFAIAEVYYRIRHEEGLGMGDVKMLAMIGAFIGWKLTLVTLMMASVAGSAIGLLMMATGRGGMKYALPFGTFLALGAAFAAVAGPGLLDWYLGQF